MRGNSWLRFVLFALLVGVLVSAAANLLLPAIFDSEILFVELVALLLVGGLVAAVISARGIFCR
jgi:hypothetical protein